MAMNFQSRLIFTFAMLSAVLPAAAQNRPHIGYVYPAGGRQGTEFHVVVGGQFLGNVKSARVSGEGVRVEFLEFNRPLNQKEFKELRDNVRELEDKRVASRQAGTNVWTREDEKLLADIRDRILKNPPNRQGNPAIAETVTFNLVVDTNALPGEREIRLATPNDLSNPMVFRVGQLPEVSKPPGKILSPEAERFRQKFGKPPPAPAKTELRVSLPIILNGQILPGAVDRFHFTARKGQQLVAVAGARDLIPYLADAVPGWFQATLALYDAKGKELAYDDDFRFHPDPVLHFEIPRDGDYVVEIKDAIYRGREDFVYRIAIGELPFVTGIFPLGGRAGESTRVDLKGWNLATNVFTVDAPTGATGIQLVPGDLDERFANQLPFAVDTLPECLEREPNNRPGNAQPLTLPIIVNGRIDRPGDVDVFSFEGRAGMEIVAEILARRLDSPVDSGLKLTDAGGKQIAFNDDCEDKGSGLNTHHADSYLRATLPADGTFYLHLSDTQRKGGEEYGYRLRMSPPRPDFELRLVPSSVSLQRGGSVALTAYALRKDGFTNELALALKDAPAGFRLSGAVIPGNSDRIRFTLSAPATTPALPFHLDFEGRAMVGGKTVSRAAVPAQDMMQAFAYRHLVPSRELDVVVSGKGPNKAVKILSATPVKLPTNGVARIQIGVGRLVDRLHFELSEPPDGVSIQNLLTNQSGMEIVLQTDRVKASPGQGGNLIVNVFAERPVDAEKAKGQGKTRRILLTTLPAIPYEFVP
jgi:hypothetical protein